MAKHTDTVWPQFPDTYPAENKGSADVIGDEQAERTGFGADDEPAPKWRWLLWPVLLVLAAVAAALCLPVIRR